MMRLNAASNVSVILFAKPHQANKLVIKINGHKIVAGTNGFEIFPSLAIEEFELFIIFPKCCVYSITLS